MSDLPVTGPAGSPELNELARRDDDQQRGVFAELGWRWRRVNNSPSAHLVPPHPGKGSRTACNALPVPRPDILSPPHSLLYDVPLCEKCARISNR